MYKNGEVVDKNYNKAFELFKKSAEGGYVDGILNLGYCYDNGIGTSVDKKRANKLYQKAKINGIISGLIDLFIKITNEGKPRDQRYSILDDYLSLYNIKFEKIYEWLNNNNNYKKDPSYTFFLGYLNFSGIGTTLNIDKAFVYFYKASHENQHAISQYYLGICYQFGFGIEINEKSAFKCYEKSAKLDNTIVGKFALGICYEKGIGTEKNKSLALNWYQKAADNGHAIAQYCIGNFYQFGICVNVDYDKAFNYYHLSAKGEYSYGINMLGYCYLKGIGTSIDESKAFELYLKAANMNNNIAQYNVAVCYEDGIGIERDSEKAMEWYKKSDNSLLASEEKEIETKKQIIQQWKLNHGLFLDGYKIQPSKQAVLVDNGDLDINLYKGEPTVYTHINDPDSCTNLLTLNNNNNIHFNDALKQLDICINFPVAEITYKANLLESVSKFIGDRETFHELYGHIFANKFLAGGQLFIRNFTLSPSNQINTFKFFLILAYNSVKNIDEISFNNDLFDYHFLPRIETSNGKNIKTPKELVNWMNNLYQENVLDIISYISLHTFSDDDNFETSIEKQPGVANYKEKLRLEEWIMHEDETDVATNDLNQVDNLINIKINYFDLIKWINDFHLLKGLTIDKSYVIENSKKVAINFIKAPKVNLCNKSYVEMMN
ncbi:hypothetical protein C1645_725633, partial [Glomus cerebriforme]